MVICLRTNQGKEAKQNRNISLLHFKNLNKISEVDYLTFEAIYFKENIFKVQMLKLYNCKQLTRITVYVYKFSTVTPPLQQQPHKKCAWKFPLPECVCSNYQKLEVKSE